jgi:hypothetical protein
MSPRCVAFAEQRSWRDLRLLDEAVPDVQWLDVGDALQAPVPLVVCGLWASREPTAQSLLERRANSGASTLLVARFEPADLGPILGAPVSANVVAGEASSITWEDGKQYEVPGVTVIDSALHDGHWARSTAGTSVLAFRPHTQAGLIVLCTATAVAQALDTDPTEQSALMHRLLGELEKRAPRRATTGSDSRMKQTVETATDYIERFGDSGALVLLATLVGPGVRVDDESLSKLGAALPPHELADLVAALPSLEFDEIRAALKRAGWSSHLRMLANIRTEAS